MRRFAIVLLAVAGLGLLPGCCNSCNRRPLFGGGLFNRSGNSRLDTPAPISGNDPLLIPPPSGGLPTPAPPEIGPRSGGASPSADLPPPVLPETRSNKPESPSRKELILPDPLPPGKGGLLESPAAVKDGEKSTSQSPVKPMPAKAVIGVTGFADLRDKVSVGRQPSLEGFESLQKSGYRTIAYLHGADADVSAMRTLVEKRGFKFVPLAVTADNIQSSSSRFAELAGDAAAAPILFCDDDGVRTGIMSYVYLRTVDGLSDDAAQVRAAPLGLRDAKGPEKEKLWTAVQEFLAKR